MTTVDALGARDTRQPGCTTTAGEHEALVATIEVLETPGHDQPFALDAVLPCGCHLYWSTHCRHGNHEKCSARHLLAEDVARAGVVVAVNRTPASCKGCSAPCRCPCHTEVLAEAANG